MNMLAHEKREFPRWETLYQEGKIESMPWFNPALDDDLEKALAIYSRARWGHTDSLPNRFGRFSGVGCVFSQ
jgi:hypothetical protein